MSQTVGSNHNRVYRLVLCGGPCGGKTTGQARLRTYFESIGWKVYRVMASESIMAGGGVKSADSRNTDKTLIRFYENMLHMKMQMEKTYFDLAAMSKQNCLIICDGGTMDIKARMTTEQWNQMMEDNGWNEVELRDSRYNQVVHMMSIADASTGRRRHFSSHEGMDIATARQLDISISQAWVGHPYYDVIDNSSDFDRKLVRMIAAVCDRLDIEYGDRLSSDSYKRKFLITKLPDVSVFPKFQDFTVVHDYLVTPIQKMQARIDRRGQNDNWTYTHTIRCPQIHRESPELKMQVTARKYELLVAQKDSCHYTVSTTRRCFLWNNQYFQLDVYEEPCPQRCKGLILLETYTSNRAEDFKLPPFLDIKCEVTGDPDYTMYNLSKKLDSALSLPSSVHDDSAYSELETSVEQSSTSELGSSVEDGALSTSSSSFPDPTTDYSEIYLGQKSCSDSDTKDVDSLPASIKNGYRHDISRDQHADLDFSKLDFSQHSLELLSDTLSENGHCFFGDVLEYERFAKWCHSGKSGAAVK